MYDESNVAKYVNVLAISLSILHNYFVDPNKIIFKYLYVAEYLDISIKSYFDPCGNLFDYVKCIFWSLFL